MTWSTSPLLEAATPEEFFATHVLARQSRFDEEPPPAERTWRTMADLLADDARLMREAHAEMIAAGDPAKAAALYLVGWVGGFLGECVGFVLATSGAGVLADERVRWGFHPDGWPDRVDASACDLVVLTGHPWTGLPGVRVVDDPDEVVDLVVGALVGTLTPYVERCRGLAKVGSNSLWAEVADGIGSATALSPDLQSRGPTIPTLEALVGAHGAPWRKRPALWCAVGDQGPMVVAQKGGCCLAYTGLDPLVGDEDGDEGDDEDHRAYAARFPHVPGEQHYCSTCSFRTREDVEARQVFWADLLARPDSAPVPSEPVPSEPVPSEPAPSEPGRSS